MFPTARAPLALALALPLTIAAAGCGFGSFGQTPEQRALSRADSLLDDVDATPDQRAKVRAVVTDLTTTFAANKKARAGSRDVMLAQLTAKTADAKVVRAEATRSTQALAANAHAVIDAGVAIHQALTPEQRAILTEKATPGRFMKAGFFVARTVGFGPPMNSDEGKARAAERLEERLDDIEATDAQKAALRPIAEGLLADALPLLDDREVIVSAFTTAWKSESPDAAKLHALVDDEIGKVDLLAQSASESFVQAHAILTPEQRTQLAAQMASGGCADGHDTGEDADAHASAK